MRDRFDPSRPGFRARERRVERANVSWLVDPFAYGVSLGVKRSPLSYRRIFVFWLPLAGTWLMMAVEGPYLAAIIARLPEATANLAAFGVAFAFAIIIESPVIMLMSASTALVEDAASFRALRRFAYGLAALVTGAQVVVLLPPVFDLIARTLQLPAEVANLTHGALAILLPWPGAIAYRRFRQGLLIRHHQTRRVAYGTVIRVAAMSLTAVAGFLTTSLPGASIAALALSVAVVIEALASRAMSGEIVAELLDRPRAAERMATLRLRALVRFYAPLGLTTFIALSSQPLVTFFMGQARFPIESLAVLPVIHGLTFIFRAVGLSYLEVVIALLGPQREHFRRLRNFAVLLAATATAGLSAIALTPLANVWFQTISGLSPVLTQFALLPLAILSVFPALSVALHLQRGILVHARHTRPTARATALEVMTIAGTLAVAIHGLDLTGAVAASIAILAGRIVGVAWLAPPCMRVLRAATATRMSSQAETDAASAEAMG